MQPCDLFIESKRADVHLKRFERDWSLWWFDTPEKGKCLWIEYIPVNWPALSVIIEDLRQAKKTIAKAKKELGFEVDNRW